MKFRSQRANTLYTVSIYKDYYTGDPTELIGAANPFETQEDDSEDVFKPVRTQSGYLRIVDNGYAADGVTPFDCGSGDLQQDAERTILTFSSLLLVHLYTIYYKKTKKAKRTKIGCPKSCAFIITIFQIVEFFSPK